MIGLLLPAGQKVREAANRASAATNLTQLTVALHDFHTKNQAFPASLGEILPFLNVPPDGTKDGYKWTLLVATPNHWKLAADPIPGVTGSESGFLEINWGDQPSIQFLPTPGSDAQRQLMLDTAFDHGAQAFATLLGLLPFVDQGNLLSMVRQNTADSKTLQQAFQMLSSPEGGGVTFANIETALANTSFADGSVRGVLIGLRDALVCDLQLGANNENVQSLPGINQLPAVQDRNYSALTDSCSSPHALSLTKGCRPACSTSVRRRRSLLLEATRKRWRLS